MAASVSSTIQQELAADSSKGIQIDPAAVDVVEDAVDDSIAVSDTPSRQVPPPDLSSLRSTVLLCHGTLRLRVSSVEATFVGKVFRPRFFALVVFDASPAGYGKGKATLSQKEGGERTVVLVWLADEAAFEAWFASLSPSAAVYNTLSMANGSKTAVSGCLGHVPVRGIKVAYNQASPPTLCPTTLSAGPLLITLSILSFPARLFFSSNSH